MSEPPRSSSLIALLLIALSLVLVPALLASSFAGVIAGAEEAACDGGSGELAAGEGSVADGLYAAPLQLVPGRAYEVGATSYGGPGDPSSGDYGAIPDPAQAYMPAHPDSFAELSVLDRNPANGGTFTFADANALDRLPYLTLLRVSHDGRTLLLAKRDIGYGQGPGQTIANGQPYRLDLWWQAAGRLGVSKDAVLIERVPPDGAAGALGALPETVEGEAPPSAECVTGTAGSVPLPLVAGTRTRILPSGLAAAGEEAPAAVRAIVAAGNRLFGAAYLYGGGHGVPLEMVQGAYDCSSAVSYVLHWGGVLGSYALDSGQLATYGLPGPGRWVSIYANAAHAFMYVAGLRFDTVDDPAFDSGPNSGHPGPRWRVSQAVPDWAAWSVRHPPGL